MTEAVDQNWCVVGLGNPGRKYAMTRHNMGFLVVEAVARRLGGELKEGNKRLPARAVKGQVAGATVHLVTPTTYMNESGVAVRKYMDYYKLGIESLVVVVDDVALPFGQVRLREQGGAGGHNGLKSIERHMGSQQYVRLRMGIGGDDHDELTGHVLGGFTAQEREELAPFVAKGVEALMCLFDEGVAAAMNKVNVKNNKKKEQNNTETEQQPRGSGAGEQ